MLYKLSAGDSIVSVVGQTTIFPTSTPAPVVGGWNGMVNSPKLVEGMTPVKWNSSSWEKANTANRWANVMLADGCNGTTTFDGSMLVWIPRFTYQIASGEHTSTAGTKVTQEYLHFTSLVVLQFLQ